MQTDDPVPLLKFAFSRAVTLTYNELRELADICKVDTAGSRHAKSGIIRCLAMQFASGDGLDGATKFADRAVDLSELPAPKQFVDPLTEAAFDQLDPDEQKEFADVKETITSSRRAGRAAQARKRAADAEDDDAGRGRARGRGRGRGRGFARRLRRRVAPPVEVEQPAHAPAPPALGDGPDAPGVPDPPAVHQAAPRAPRDPDVFDWASGSAKFQFTRRRGATPGWQVRCLRHPAEVNSRGNTLSCTRELGQQALVRALPDVPAADLDDCVLRQLKHWCLSGWSFTERGDHMSPVLFPRVVPLESLPSNEALEAALTAVGQ